MNNLVPITEFRQQLSKMEPEFVRSLPAHIPPERFARATETAVNGNPKLLDCNRASLLKAVMVSAECGLMPNGREAAIVPFKQEAQFIPMFGGLLKLMRNSDEVREIYAETVHEHDEFEALLGDEASINHKPNMLGDRGDTIGAYAILHTKDGGTYRAIMSKAEIDRIRDASPGYRSAIKYKKDHPWISHYGEMAKKTILRRLAKICPLSTDRIDQVMEADNATIDLTAMQVDRPRTKLESMHDTLTSKEPEKIDHDQGSEEGDDVAKTTIDGDTGEVMESKPAKKKVQKEDVKGDDDSPLLKGHVYDSPEAALDKFRGFKIPDDLEEYDGMFDGWRMDVEASFVKPVADGVIKQGQGEYNQKRLEVEKGVKK